MTEEVLVNRNKELTKFWKEWMEEE